MWLPSFGKYFRRTPDASSYQFVERTLEPAMFVLGLLFIPVVLGPWLADMSDESKAASTRCRLGR